MIHPWITLFLLLLPLSALSYQICPQIITYTCPDFFGQSHSLLFPFTNTSLPDCGLCVLNCTNSSTTIECGKQISNYKTKAIFPDNKTEVLIYPGLSGLIANICTAHQKDSVIVPTAPLTTNTVLGLMVYFRCHVGSGEAPTQPGKFRSCPGNDVVYGPYGVGEVPRGLPEGCSTIKLPNSTDDSFSIAFQLPGECALCEEDRSRCIDRYSKEFHCPAKGKRELKIILVSVLTGFVLLTILAIIMYWRKRKITPGSTTLALAIDSFRQIGSDVEEGMLNGVTLFSYTELEDATNKFDPTRELGEGGFGKVYHGKLRDGREVAVKRLFEKNHNRIEQFKNEIRILTGLRHPNLVTLYGCTSRHSRELLLVYEYIPNGTVTDHLYGDHPKSRFMTWSTRMSIAIETAEALSYLHCKDIIHRDVKTTNILLDYEFNVKVADFGLSRLFPADVTHVSTAPQGTPGYLDPEYHQCYQLTDRSDVYSFGVVLIELVSSLPAVDLGRHRCEINLSNYAINKIQSCAFEELVDPELGFDTDLKVRQMTTMVAELAFRCLQQDRDLRPSMEEVLCVLTRIASLEYDVAEDAQVLSSSVLRISTGQLKQGSPDSVMGKWLSQSTATDTSS